jgi:hypothetical protein
MKRVKSYIPRVHRVCPVCRFQKTFSGECCPDCKKLGYKLNEKTGRIRRTV